MTGPFAGGDNGGDPGERRGGGVRDQVSVPKAVALVIVAVVLGVILLNVAARPTPKSNQAAASSSSSSTTTTTTRPPASTTTSTTAPNPSVTVLVANGTTVPNAATFFSTKLKAAGWNTLPPVDTTTPVPASAVYYAAGEQKPAQALATALGLKASVVQPLTTAVPVSGTTGADLVAVLGPDTASQATTTTTS